MTIVESWQQAIMGRGISVRGRAEWVTMQVQGCLVGFLNIFVSNHASARTEFLVTSSRGLTSCRPVVHWGDFSMLEDPLDRIEGSHATVHEAELAALKCLCLALRISDVCQHTGFARPFDSLSFSRYDNKGGVSLSRKDRFYVSDHFCDMGGTICIMAGIILCDHAPVILTLAHRQRSGSGMVRDPKRIFLDKELREQVFAIRIESPDPQRDVSVSMAKGLEERHRCLIVTEKMHHKLESFLMPEELQEALRALPHGSCLGEDGLTPNFLDY